MIVAIITPTISRSRRQTEADQVKHTWSDRRLVSFAAFPSIFTDIILNFSQFVPWTVFVMSRCYSMLGIYNRSFEEKGKLFLSTKGKLEISRNAKI